VSSSIYLLYNNTEDSAKTEKIGHEVVQFLYSFRLHSSLRELLYNDMPLSRLFVPQEGMLIIDMPSSSKEK
jgi:hypothetical protein